MKICQRCNLSYNDNFSFCAKCGTPLAVIIETVFCPFCGNHLDSDMEFCPYCGKSLLAESSPVDNNSPINRSVSDSNNNNTISQSYSISNYNPPSPQSFGSRSIFDYIKNTPVLKWLIIVVLYVINFIAFLLMDTVSRTYKLEALRSMNGLPLKGNALSGGNLFLWVIGTYLIFAVSWYVIKKLHTRAASVFFYLVIFIATCNLLTRFLGFVWGSIIIIGYFAWEYFLKKKHEN